MEFTRYYSQLVTVGRRNNPSMGEARSDLIRAFGPIITALA